jgi:hypothetical protein
MRHDDAPGIRLEKPHDVLQRNRLPNPTSPKNANGFSSVHLEGDVTQHMVLSESLRDGIELDVRSSVRLGGHGQGWGD